MTTSVVLILLLGLAIACGLAAVIERNRAVAEAVAECVFLQTRLDHELAARELDCRALETHISQSLRRRARLSTLAKGLGAVEALIAESRGVAGLHLNGDEAPWAELLAGGRCEEWLKDFSIAVAAAKEMP